MLTVVQPGGGGQINPKILAFENVLDLICGEGSEGDEKSFE